MCTNYTPSSRDRLRAAQLGVAHLPPADWPPEVYPGYEAPIVIRGGAPGQHDVAPRCLLARFGLVPRWSRDAAHAKELSRHTTNARSETAAVKPSFRSPWRERHWALAPMENFFEPCWETGHAVRWRIARADGDLFAAAGLWERWTDPASGEITASFTLLTVNADGHPLMARMHRPGDEKRMPVLLAPGDFDDWLHATDEQAHAMVRGMSAAALTGEPAPRPPPPRALRRTARPPAPDDTGSLF
jgi:putative SOS response-associated peptidase YedK